MADPRQTLLDALEAYCDGLYPQGEYEAMDAAEVPVMEAVRMMCAMLGHSPIPDHCSRPEHDRCLYCGVLTPGEAQRAIHV